MTEPVPEQKLEEGSLYVFKKGVLHEIETDPEDTMKKVRLTADAFAKASALQNRMRQHLQGYRPDISTVCSALIKHGAQQPEATDIVRQFAIELFQSFQHEAP